MKEKKNEAQKPELFWALRPLLGKSTLNTFPPRLQF